VAIAELPVAPQAINQPNDSPVEYNQIVKVAFASLIGTSIEWYDYFLYGTAAALVFNKLFFPSYDPLVGTLLAFATFSLGFIARPVGGIVFGHYGDKIGRKKMLYLTLMIMGLSTAFIGLLPIMWSTGTGADVMKRIAAPMVGGLATSFLLELLVYPSIYFLWKRRSLPSFAQTSVEA